MSTSYQDTSCPSCGSDNTRYVNQAYGVLLCDECGEHFDESDGVPSRERGERTRLTERDE